MAPAHYVPPDNIFLTIPLEIRREIYRYCIPQHQVFDCSRDMYYQNRPVGWTQPSWRSATNNRDGYISNREAFIREAFDREGPRITTSHEVYKIKSKLSAAKEEEEEDEQQGEEVESIEDSSTNEDGSYYSVEEKEEEEFLETPSSSSSHEKTRGCALLLVRRQMTDEVEELLYEGNTFTIDLDHYQSHPDNRMRQFVPRIRERIRRIILILQPIEEATTAPTNNSPYPYQHGVAAPAPFSNDPDIWGPLLSNLAMLGVSISRPTSSASLLEDLISNNNSNKNNNHNNNKNNNNNNNDNDADSNFWTDLANAKQEAVARRLRQLRPVFEYLVAAVPAHVRIAIDAATHESDGDWGGGGGGGGEGDGFPAPASLDLFFRDNGRFLFRRLPVADCLV